MKRKQILPLLTVLAMMQTQQPAKASPAIATSTAVTIIAICGSVIYSIAKLIICKCKKGPPPDPIPIPQLPAPTATKTDWTWQ